MLAERIGVSATTASESIRKLADQGLVDHEKYGAVTLTEAGRGAALAMVRRHRLMETYLVRELGYSWDEVHDEAEVLEHAVSELMMARIDAKLGHPSAIPTAIRFPPPTARCRLRPPGNCRCAATATPAPWPESRTPTRRCCGTSTVSASPWIAAAVLARRDFAGIIRSVESALGRPRRHHGRAGKPCGPGDLDGQLAHRPDLQRRRAHHHHRFGSRRFVCSSAIPARPVRPPRRRPRYPAGSAPCRDWSTASSRSGRGGERDQAGLVEGVLTGAAARRARPACAPDPARTRRPGCVAARSDVHLRPARRRCRGPGRECRCR